MNAIDRTIGIWAVNLLAPVSYRLRPLIMPLSPGSINTVYFSSANNACARSIRPIWHGRVVVVVLATSSNPGGSQGGLGPRRRLAWSSAFGLV